MSCFVLVFFFKCMYSGHILTRASQMKVVTEFYFKKNVKVYSLQSALNLFYLHFISSPLLYSDLFVVFAEGRKL